jgi:hypothetical protein
VLLQEAGDNLHPTSWPVNKRDGGLFNWYESHKNTLHPLLLAAETQPKNNFDSTFHNKQWENGASLYRMVLLQHG